MAARTVEEMMVPMKMYPHLPDSVTIADALVIMKMKRWLSETPDGRVTAPHVPLVFNADLRFVGIVRRRHILRALQPGFLTPRKIKHMPAFFDVAVDSDISEFNIDHLAKDMRERAQKKIKDIMEPLTTTINHDAHLMKAINQIVEADTRFLPVVKEGKIIGMLRSDDVLREVESLLDLDRK